MVLETVDQATAVPQLPVEAKPFLLQEQYEISLLPTSSSLSTAAVHQAFPETNSVVVCDTYVVGSETGEATDYGFVHEGIINIDHHAPVEKMMQPVTATHLALAYVKDHGIVPAEVPVVITHTDADSILSSFILRGILPPEERFVQATLAADHTGEENPIADLLQALEGKNDIAFSQNNLLKLLAEQPLDPEAQQLLNARLVQRARAQTLVDSGIFQFTADHRIAYATLSEFIDSIFWPSLLPNAQIIVTYLSHAKNQATWEAKIRRGQTAPDYLLLNALGITKRMISGWGGRWNAGSNNRHEAGTTIPINDFVTRISRRLAALDRAQKKLSKRF